MEGNSQQLVDLYKRKEYRLIKQEEMLLLRTKLGRN